MAKTMKVSEIFASIQGESTLQGLPCLFIRLAGCNLNCRYCDTVYARGGGKEMTLSGIIKEAEKSKLKYVCITGGEPLLQRETPELALELLNRGCRVSIETNGTLDASKLHENIIRVIDIKCPGSGEHGKTSPENITEKRPSDEYKFVITDRNDFEYARNFVKKHNLTVSGTVLFSPVYSILEPKKLVEWIIKEMPEARLNLQIHKYIWHDSSEKEG
ncbi:7-carboxy-7-deazaguanine synthase [subsurface metagenome]